MSELQTARRLVRKLESEWTKAFRNHASQETLLQITARLNAADAALAEARAARKLQELVELNQRAGEQRHRLLLQRIAANEEIGS